MIKFLSTNSGLFLQGSDKTLVNLRLINAKRCYPGKGSGFKPGQYFLIVHENTDSSRENLAEQFFSGCIHNNRMNVFFQQLAKLSQVFDSFQVSRFYVFSVDEDCNVNIAIGNSLLFAFCYLCLSKRKFLYI